MKVIKWVTSKFSYSFLWLGVALSTNLAYADSSADAGTTATNIAKTLTGVESLIATASLVAGLGFMVASVLKFKAHKDNPTQIPVGTPIALLFVGTALMFLPSLISVLSHTVFGSSAEVVNSSGTNFAPSS